MKQRADDQVKDKARALKAWQYLAIGLTMAGAVLVQDLPVIKELAKDLNLFRHGFPQYSRAVGHTPSIDGANAAYLLPGYSGWLSDHQADVLNHTDGGGLKSLIGSTGMEASSRRVSCGNLLHLLPGHSAGL